jgi:filamentous hemagglutinin family protein
MVLNPHLSIPRSTAAGHRQPSFQGGDLRLAPLARAVALALAAGSVMGGAHAQRAFSAGWMAQKNVVQSTAAATGQLPNGMPASMLTNPLAQQQKASQQLQRSINNLNLAAQAIAAQQAAQAAARQAAMNDPSAVPDGLADGGLAVDTNSLTAGWLNAKAPVQTQSGGRTNVAIQQTADRAVLNWETFNVGRNTTVQFQQQSDWSVLNRVNDPQARPSQIRGQIQADGTVLIVNRNGIVFSGSSQIDTRNLVAAAARISDDQFKNHGIYSAQSGTDYTPSFTDALGAVTVEAGARITTSTPGSVTQGGGYALLMGTEVSNAGTITTPRGQVQLAAGDQFAVRAGQSTDANQFSTTRGNEVAPLFNTDSTAGKVANTGLLQAPEGDITLTGRQVRQDGVALSTTTVNTRGTLHLLASASDAQSAVAVGANAVNAILLDDSGGTALDSQRDALITESAKQDFIRRSTPQGVFDSFSLQDDRRDQSRIEIVSGGGVMFEGGSTTLATGGQLAVSAGPTAGRSTVADGARLDVSGAVGVQLTMASNNILVNIQGNEQRDAPVNRDTTLLNSSNVWIDRRQLIRVAAGVGGYDGERWYTPGGLLEVGGYLGLQGRTIGEWAAQGGSVSFTGGEVVTQAGSNINLSGGTLDVQSGIVHQSWLKGADGRLYEVSSAPADFAYTGVYRGFEDTHQRWGDKTTGFFMSPLIGPDKRLEDGYTVGRDAGRLVIATGAAVLDGDITAEAFQGPKQVQKSDAGLDSLYQSHNAAAQAGQLIVGSYTSAYNGDATMGPVGVFHNLASTLDAIVFADGPADGGVAPNPADPLPQKLKDALYLDSAQLNSFGLGSIIAVAGDSLTVDGALTVVPGGTIGFHSTKVAINADLTARGGSIALGNVLNTVAQNGAAVEGALPAAADAPTEVVLAKGVTLDARGLWTNLKLGADDGGGLPYVDGGSVDIRSTGDVTLEAGTLIDVSSGGAVLVDGKTRGGRGGDVTLIADAQTGGDPKHGLLTLDGDIRGYGANGGGTLRMESGTGIVIGGNVVGTGGVLGAGEAAPTDLILLQDYQVHAGDILPADYSYQRTLALTGEAVGTSPNFTRANPVTLGAEWTVPYAAGAFAAYNIDATVNGVPEFIRVESSGAPVVFPAGTVLNSISGSFPSDYILPPGVFPDGMPVVPQTTTIAAGKVAPADFTIASGARVAAGAVFNQAVSARPGLSIDAGVFQSGFAHYDVNGRLGVIVADNARLDVVMPVYRFAAAAQTAATGSDPAAAMELWTPPTWQEDPVQGVLTQRGGASLVLESTSGPGAAAVVSGPIDVRPGAVLTVDPGQSITLRGRDVTVDGTLRAPGGVIAIAGGEGLEKPALIWIGDHAVLDVAARAASAQDAFGRTYGQVSDGGTISVGGALDWEDTGEAHGVDAFIVVRPGALLDASGAGATFDHGGSGPVTVASGGGSIILKSSQGLYPDGTLRAAAGGAGAAGGTLALALESQNYPTDTTSGDVLRHRELVFAQVQGDSPAASALTLADAKNLLLTGTARVGVDRIEAGGFDNLSMLVNGPLSFDGDVALHMGQSLRLYAGTYAHGENAATGSTVSLSAPYVRLAGVTNIAAGVGQTLPSANWSDGPSQRQGDGSFSVVADLIDIRDRVGFGSHADIDLQSSKYTVDRRGFETVELTSSGDIRLLGGKTEGLGGDVTTELATPGNLTLTAAQIYPATGASARILAGYTLPDPITGDGGDYAPGSVLAIHRYGEGEVAVPWSAFGSLILGADTIEQGGIVRAPLGRLILGSHVQAATADHVNLLAGSITSVSGEGLLMPYGGTVDGLSYLYGGQAVMLDSLANATRGIQLKTSHVDAEAGAVLDLSGGGTLTGAGFVTGRGGSVDILSTPLVNANPTNRYSSAGNAVYAIVPGGAARYAPVAPEAGFGMPGIGQQITVPAGVPGLPAGTYTLMPSNYALLPGAFRVEVGAAGGIGLSGVANVTGVAGVGDGSYVTAGYLGVANTAIREAQPNQIIITPGDRVRAHSGYNETDYNAFVLADAARHGFVRGMLTSDAKTLDILLSMPADDDAERTGLKFDGDLRIGAQAGTEGFSGTVNVRNLGEVLPAGQAATEGLTGASVYDSELNKLGVSRLVLNGAITSQYGQGGRIADIAGGGSLIVRSGASLSAADLILVSSPGFLGDQAVTIEEGASLSTIGRGAASFDSSDGFVFTGNGVLALSNGWFDLHQAPPVDVISSTVAIHIGSCVSAACNGPTRLLSEGTLAIATEGALTLADNVSYGTRNLVLGLAAVNLGEDASIAAASANGQLPSGLVLNQARLGQLLAGNTATGAPALETLVLNARDAVNIYGAVKLDASSLDRLVLGTPAIYGYGAAGDVASIRAGEFVWTGSAATPGAAMAGLLGDGTLDIAARSIVLGYGPNSQPDNTATDARIALGFAGVNLSATERITSDGSSALSVYHRQGAYTPGEGYAYDGGDLAIVTPLLTGGAGSNTRITAGGAVTVTAPEGTGTAASGDALGATLELKGRSVSLEGSIVLPSGRLVLTAADDIVLGAASRIDLAGRDIAMFDVDKYSWGGDLVLFSDAGNITQASGSVIDVSARNNRGGTVEATALGAGAGRVDLAGAIKGDASGTYDAGGTVVPYDAAELTVRTQTLADFAGLNSRLNDGGVFGARRFQIKQGDLTVGDGVKAREVAITLDGGSLTVDGRIDASGFQVGTIRLAAMGDLTVNGTLDAHGSGLRVDSYGKIIDSPNRALVDLTSSQGMLTLGGGASIDLRAGTDVAAGTGPGQNDGRARGTLDLNAPRVGADDVAVTVNGVPAIQGAKTVAVNAFRSYDDAPLAGVPDVSGFQPQLITQTYLDGIDVDSQAFINAALGNAALGTRLSGLGSYHLRPGVEIVSNSLTNPHGDLTVSGDIDLSGYRYGPDTNRGDPALRGFGEPGLLVIRAAGDLNIHGSINDGFAPPPGTPDDNGWVLTEARSASGLGYTPFGGDIVVPIDGVVLDTGTRFPAGATLNYGVPVAAMTLPAGTVLPVDAVLTGALSLSAGTVVAANIYNVDGSVAYAAGTVLPAAVTLDAGTRLGAGTSLRSTAAVDALTWPKGVKLPVEMTVTAPVALAQGSLIPSMTWVELPGDLPINLRPSVNGAQGRNWAVAPMLGEGASSWDLQLVAGADLGSADRRALNPASKGAIKLGDTHYVMGFTISSGNLTTWAAGNFFGYPEGTPVSDGELFWCDLDPTLCVVTPGQPSITGSAPAGPAFSVVRTGTGDLEMLAAGDIRTDSLYGIYTAGASTAVDAGYNLPRGTAADGTLVGPQSSLLDYASSLATYRAWYPDQGGNVLISAGGNLVGDLTGAATSSVLPGNWLWRQGSGTAAVDAAIPTAWWINFGAYVASTVTAPNLVGFTGIGTLGGGDVTIRVGGNAGAIDLRGGQIGDVSPSDRSEGLMVAVGSTGRVGADGALTLTGGGDIDMRLAGALNPNRHLSQGTEKLVLTGAIANLRGRTELSAASIGSVGLEFPASAGGLADELDPRGKDPFVATYADARGGINLVPGDTAISLQTLGDLVLGGAADPGRSNTPNSSAFSVDGTSYGAGGQGWFSLWTGHSAINLVAAGGNLTPTSATRNGNQILTTSQDGWIIYPSIFRAAALTGSLYYGYAALPPGVRTSESLTYGLTLAPSPTGELEMLAGDSIYAGQYPVSMSGTGTPLPTPFEPAFVGQAYGAPGIIATNVSKDGSAIAADAFVGPALFAFGPNTAAAPIERAADAPPARFYAVDGDIIGLKTGETASFNIATNRGTLTWYNASGPVRIEAGRDIVNTGTAPGTSTVGPNEIDFASLRGNLIVHTNPDDVSIVSAGRDILYANFDIAGPGTLEITAGRNFLQEDRGGISSIGPIVPGDKRPGASIALMAGVGASGLDMSSIRALYLDPSKRADPAEPLASQPGKVAKTYEAELADWLKARYGFSGDSAQALAYFDALAPEQQRIFLRTVYFDELREGGREYNNPDSGRFGSYLRGREMIAALFPAQDAAGNEIARGGDITMFGGSGVRTDFGGDIEMLAPGGKIIVGVQGEAPPATAGVMTQGAGDIRMYSQQSLLLGLSRIMTTFGGDILAWSAQGDINAGRGAKTTVLFTPPKLVYDDTGNVTISPQVPSSGAGIATLAPIAEVPPGDVDLIAPLGTIDAGEAGIRVSGNVNLAALQVVNAANIQVKGESAGIPTVAAVNVAALTNASAAASQATVAAQDAVQRERTAARQALPSIFTVRVLGFGNEPASGEETPTDDKRGTPVSYNPRSVIRVLGGSASLPPSASRQLTDEERANLQR